MKICKVKPGYDACCTCIDWQMDLNKYEDCKECTAVREGEILSVGPASKKGGYVMVLIDGIIQSIHINRIFDVKEKKEHEKNKAGEEKSAN